MSAPRSSRGTSSRTRGGIRDGAGTIDGLQPSTQTLCAMIGDARIAGTVKLTCKQLTLTTAAQQTAAIVVPSAWLD